METLFEVQDNTREIDTEMLVLDNDPYSRYSPSNPYTQANYDPPEKEYSLDADGHFIIYDIDEEDTPYSSNRTTFVRNFQNLMLIPNLLQTMLVMRWKAYYPT